MRIRTAQSRALPGKRVQRELQDSLCADVYIGALTRIPRLADPDRERGLTDFDRIVLDLLTTTPEINDEPLYLSRMLRADLQSVLRS